MFMRFSLKTFSKELSPNKGFAIFLVKYVIAQKIEEGSSRLEIGCDIKEIDLVAAIDSTTLENVRLMGSGRNFTGAAPLREKVTGRKTYQLSCGTSVLRSAERNPASLN